MSESGCNACPVVKCDAVYRSSRCAAYRDRHGLGDPWTNADRIRAMSDEELAKLLYCSDSLGWCHNNPECADMLDTDDGIPEEKCMVCLVAWLKRPAEE